MRMSRIVCVLLLCAYAVVGDRHRIREARAASRPVPDEAERTKAFWYHEAQTSIKKRAHRSSGSGKAKNIVLFLGDGMSIPTIAAARVLLGQRYNRTGEENELSFESFPSLGLTKTYCVDEQIADSACSATAYLCGAKSNNGMVGLTAAVTLHDCEASLDPSTHLESIAAWAIADGRDVGLVTNTRITHATPSALYARSPCRYWENDHDITLYTDDRRCLDIAHQLVHHHPGNKFKVILGGGRREFYENTTVDDEGTTGKRTDSRNLVREWLMEKRSRKASHSYLWNRNQLKSSMNNPPDYILGLFEDNHIPYHLEANPDTEPTLAEMTELAIKSLQRNDKGFFLFVESGRIDHAHHDNYVELALDETIRLHDAVKVATDMLPEEDSLVVVTSDHSHAMAFNGYQARGGDILGASDEVDQNGVPYMTLSYTNGPGARKQSDGVRVDVTADENFRGPRWQPHAEVPRSSETHGGEDVAVFARGPHHHMFTGLYEQSQLPHLMAYAGCFGPGLHACNAAADLGNTISLFKIIAVVMAVHYRTANIEWL